ncbi:MAG: hypothetical protein AMXMBFR84_03550 [Candidatus Hydrogenedentota bacterium]
MEKNELPFQKMIFVCCNQREPGDRVCCADCGGPVLQERLKAMVKERQLRSKIRVSKSGCMDRCEDGPNLMIFPDNIWLSGVQESDLEGILDSVAGSLK